MIAEKRTTSGRSSASLSVDVNGHVGTLYGSSSFLVMERGRGPGKVPYRFFDIIRQWIKDKGISVTPIPSKRLSAISPEERGLNSLAGAIAYTIMKKGTRLHRDGGLDDIYSSVIKEELELMSKELVINSLSKISTINNTL